MRWIQWSGQPFENREAALRLRPRRRLTRTIQCHQLVKVGEVLALGLEWTRWLRKISLRWSGTEMPEHCVGQSTHARGDQNSNQAADHSNPHYQALHTSSARIELQSAYLCSSI